MTAKNAARKQALCTTVTCPYCKRRMQARNLAYRHICKKQPTEYTDEELQQVSLRKLDRLLGRAVYRLSGGENVSIT
jgi:ABC-type cobalamin transport system ATPase subunit